MHTFDYNREKVTTTLQSKTSPKNIGQKYVFWFVTIIKKMQKLYLYSMVFRTQINICKLNN